MNPLTYGFELIWITSNGPRDRRQCERQTAEQANNTERENDRL